MTLQETEEAGTLISGWTLDDAQHMFTVVLLLATAALIAGAVAGILEALKFQAMGPWRSFLIFLGLAGVASTTFTESMEILPLTLIYAAVAGVAPFMSAYFGLRYAVSKGRRT